MNILAYVVGAIGAWIVYLEVRFKASQSKVLNLEQEKKEDEIASKIHALSDADLEQHLSANLESKSDH